MKYLKKFENDAAYQAYVATDYAKPNVSYCVSENEVHYNPWVETKLVVTYNVSTTSSPTKIANFARVSAFTEIEIDGVVQPTVVSAYTFSTTGEHTVKYTLRDNTTIEANLFYYYFSGITSVFIPNTVTSIGDDAFGRCSGLTSIDIPDSVVSIGERAFYSCLRLRSVTISNGTIGASAFSTCNISELTLKEGVTSIGEMAFWYNQISHLTIPDSVVSIGEQAFDSSYLLTGVTFGTGMTSIGDRVFSNCRGITSIGGVGSGASLIIPNHITSIGNNTFASCTGLTFVNIPSTVTSIGKYAFSYASALTDVYLDCSVIGEDAFDHCGVLSSVTFGSNVTTIGYEAFNRCLSLSSITVPNTVSAINDRAYANCSGLTSVSIDCASIGASAFTYCVALETINLGANVTTIASRAFNGTAGSVLATITSLATTAPTIANSAFMGVKTGGTLTVPSGSSGYDVWMGTGDYYLGKYNWTKVEQ